MGESKMIVYVHEHDHVNAAVVVNVDVDVIGLDLVAATGRAGKSVYSVERITA